MIDIDFSKIQALILRSSAPPRHLHKSYIPARFNSLTGIFISANHIAFSPYIEHSLLINPGVDVAKQYFAPAPPQNLYPRNVISLDGVF
jgi:hypothetical protein